MDAISYYRWNSFIDQVNEFVDYVNKREGTGYSRISSSCKMTSSDRQLYASDFNQVVRVIKNIAGSYSTTVPSSLGRGDPVYGWYFPSLSGAINSIP